MEKTVNDIDFMDFKRDIENLRTQNVQLRNECSDNEQKLIALSLMFQLLKSALEEASIEVHDVFMLNVRRSQAQLYEMGGHKLSQNLDDILGD